MISMKTFALAFTLSTCLFGQTAYTPKGWVWCDKQDTDGKWHLGSKDKRQHFIAGAIVGGSVVMYAEHNGWKHPRLWGIVAAFAIGYAKEIHDMRKGSGTAERADVLWTGLGGVVGTEIVSFRW